MLKCAFSCIILPATFHHKSTKNWEIFKDRISKWCNFMYSSHSLTLIWKSVGYANKFLKTSIWISTVFLAVVHWRDNITHIDMYVYPHEFYYYPRYFQQIITIVFFVTSVTSKISFLVSWGISLCMIFNVFAKKILFWLFQVCMWIITLSNL